MGKIRNVLSFRFVSAVAVFIIFVCVLFLSVTKSNFPLSCIVSTASDLEGKEGKEETLWEYLLPGKLKVELP